MGNTILLADKIITIQKIVELTFSDESFEIKCVNDGQSALDAIPSVRPAIILADINLPVKTGYEVCQALRTDPAFAAYATIPVILLAGIYETMDEDRAKQVEDRVRHVGANDLLSKPFDPQLLTSKVKELVERSLPATTMEIPAPSPFLAEPPEQEGIFSTVPADSGMEPPTELIHSMPPSPPPDDSEKTMMLPSPVSFTSNMFAEEPPMEETAPESLSEERTVPVETVTPMNEPLFEMKDLEGVHEPERLEEVPEPEIVEMPEPPGGPFEGREEVEFSFDTQPGVPEEAPPQPAVESPFSDLDKTPVPPLTRPSFVPATGDPFADVFGEAPPQTWSAAAPASEEESPFGLPEPQPAPEPPPVHEPELAAEAERSTPIEQPWVMPAQQPPQEIPTVEAEAADSAIAGPPVEEEGQKALEEIMAVPGLKPEFGEDTWSRARKVAEGPVEELFESEAAPVEETVELQPDLSEAAAVSEGQSFQEAPQE
ncbi:MAG TPA: response regulator, partial [Acidobacteriota bacterium]|nr:response regulator [Acidobacteriota bacterium]